MNDRLLTKYEVMETLKISRKHFEKLVKEKELPMIQITPYKRYVRSSHLNRYIDERTINKPQEITQKRMILNGRIFGGSDDETYWISIIIGTWSLNFIQSSYFPISTLINLSLN